MADCEQQPIYDLNHDQPSCSSTYGRIGNAYGRIDIIGHGIGRIERHLSSSCGSINSNHYALESLYGTIDGTGRISKVSVQWLLSNKWLPLWIANTDNGRDYRIIDFLLAQGMEVEEVEQQQQQQPQQSQQQQQQQQPQQQQNEEDVSGANGGVSGRASSDNEQIPPPN